MGPRPKFKAHILSPTLTHFLQAYKQGPYKPKQTSKKSARPALGMSGFLPRKARHLSLLLSPESPACWPQTSAPACCPLLLHAKHTCTALGLFSLAKAREHPTPMFTLQQAPAVPVACMHAMQSQLCHAPLHHAKTALHASSSCSSAISFNQHSEPASKLCAQRSIAAPETPEQPATHLAKLTLL